MRPAPMARLARTSSTARLVVALAAALGAGGPVGCRGDARPDYVTSEARRGTVREVVTATGQVEARTKVNVGSQISGTVAEVCVDYGTQVRRGQLLARLDPQLVAAQHARAQASVALAQAGVAKAAAELHDRRRTGGRLGHLGAQDLAAQAELDAADVALRLAEAGAAGAAATLAQARADEALAAANVAATRITSPIDGVVLDRQIDVGQTVAAQFQVATLFTLAADMRRVQVVAHVDEADVGKLWVGMPAHFRVAAYPTRSFAGTVTEVRPAPTVLAGASAAVVTYAAVVQADNADGALRQGMTAELEAVVRQADDVVRVPVAALRFRPEGEARRTGTAAEADANASPDAKPDAAVDGAADAGDNAVAGPKPRGAGCADAARRTLYVAERGTPKARAVDVGIDDGQYAAVCAGLQGGEPVVVGVLPRAGARKRR